MKPTKLKRRMEMAETLHDRDAYKGKGSRFMSRERQDAGLSTLSTGSQHSRANTRSIDKTVGVALLGTKV